MRHQLAAKPRSLDRTSEEERLKLDSDIVMDYFTDRSILRPTLSFNYSSSSHKCDYCTGAGTTGRRNRASRSSYAAGSVYSAIRCSAPAAVHTSLESLRARTADSRAARSSGESSASRPDSINSTGHLAPGIRFTGSAAPKSALVSHWATAIAS